LPGAAKLQASGPACSTAADRIDLLVSREAAGLFFRKCKTAVDGNFEHPADAWHQLDLGAVFFD
jgi:hypothetical protein